MTNAALDLRDQLSRLPDEDRVELAEFLLDSLDPSYEEQIAAEWESELKRREEDILTGRTVGIPAEQVMAELRQRYEKRT